MQYLRYVGGLLRGDFGPSLRQRDFTVRELIGQGLPVSVTLGLAALARALRPRHPGRDRRGAPPRRRCRLGIGAVAALAIALPSFVSGPLLVLVFGLYLHWLPAAGWQADAPRYLVLPVMTLALPVVAYLARLMRASLLEVLAAHYVRTRARRGLGEVRVLWRHALRPALMPVVSYLGPAVAFVVTGSLVVETRLRAARHRALLVQGAINRDYTLVMGMIVVYGALTLVCNLVADLALRLARPGRAP